VDAVDFLGIEKIFPDVFGILGSPTKAAIHAVLRERRQLVNERTVAALIR